ncbi:MAG TPA: acetylglutamate kinase [Candidatus Baltobacteraceae bacterium]|nr:acetylglutamate kinase [Candidatus Baltobacteraceae bacterium]
MSHNYASRLAERLIVVKYGGNAMPANGPDPVLAELAELWRAGTPIVLVHGGGPAIDAALSARGIVTERVDGLRVTDAATLEVTEAALCGTVNKALVRSLNVLTTPAVGVSGQDGGMLIADQMRATSGADLGFVGTVVRVETLLLRSLLAAGYLPVVAPLAVTTDGAYALNVNADLAAAAIAGALRAHAFVQVTNVSHVLRDPNDASSWIERLSLAEAADFFHSSACQSGMKPKVQAAIDAVAAGSKAAYVCSSKVRAISRALSGESTVIA